MDSLYDPLTGKVGPVFLRYALPSVIGMLAATSAGVIDGIFIGNFVGAGALAAVNISMPVFAIFAGVVFMLAVGGSVTCGRYLGLGDKGSASLIFSKTLWASLVVSLLISGGSLAFLDVVVRALGANEELAGMVRIYLMINLLAAPLLIMGLTLDYFVRVDGRPVLAAMSLVAFAVINISLDALFIVVMGWGITGAALATALAEVSVFFLLVTHWLSGRSNLRFVSFRNCARDGWRDLAHACWNGLSEFTNEMSIGLITLLFNWVMITRLGVPGVAAFTIIGYLLMIGLEICYGISEALQPTVSKNLGAAQPERITRFLWTALGASLSVGLLVSAVFLFAPHILIAMFLRSGELETEAIALAFIAVFWPAFLFNGMNLTLASYFTALHRPIQSASIAISRSLLLPGLGLLLLPAWLGDRGVYAAIPLAEALTFVLAVSLAIRHRPAEIVRKLDGDGVTGK